MSVGRAQHLDAVLRREVPQLQQHHRQVLDEEQSVHQAHGELHHAAVLHLQEEEEENDELSMKEENEIEHEYVDKFE